MLWMLQTKKAQQYFFKFSWGNSSVFTIVQFYRFSNISSYIALLITYLSLKVLSLEDESKCDKSCLISFICLYKMPQTFCGRISCFCFMHCLYLGVGQGNNRAFCNGNCIKHAFFFPLLFYLLETFWFSFFL